MTWTVAVHDSSARVEGKATVAVFEYDFDTEAEAVAFHKGVQWASLNDEAITVDNPVRYIDPEPGLAHCDTCGRETADRERVGTTCAQAVYVPAEDAVVQACPGTYVEGPAPIYTLTRLEEVDVTYDVKGATLTDAIEYLLYHETDMIVDRLEDAAAYFSAGEIRYLGEDEDGNRGWFPEDADARPVLAGEEES